MAVIDAHVHVYPEKIAERAVRAISDFYGGLREATLDASPSGLLQLCEGSPVTHFLLLPVAAKPSNVERNNDFIAQLVAENPQFKGMMCLHPDSENLDAEVERCKAMGLCGIKVHPDMQKCAIDDERMMNIFAVAEQHKLPVVVHTGDYRTDYSHPRLLGKVLAAFPNLVLSAAHFGGWSLFDIAADLLKNERCFVDTSSSMTLMGPRHSRELINMYGVHRVLFGSDFPMCSPVQEELLVREMGLSAADYEAITWKNAQDFLGMEL